MLKKVFVKICCVLLALFSVVGIAACNGSVEDSGPDYDDPTRDPFGKYENTVKITGVMEYQAHNDSRVPQSVTPDNQAFIKLLKETDKKKLLIVIGSNKLIDFMVKNSENKKRNTGLKEKLKEQ